MLSPDVCYSYIVEEYCEQLHENFTGAPESFKATIRINLKDETEAKEWIKRMSNHSSCTYRITRSYKPSLKSVLYRTDMHCQHQRKQLTQKQLASKAAARKSKYPLMGGLRQKKTECPSHLVTERGALADVWPDACLLLCTFHFLQSRWTWLYDSKN